MRSDDIQPSCLQGPLRRRYSVYNNSHTFILKEIAHPCPARQDQLGDVLDDFGFDLGSQGAKPFRQTDLA